MKVVDTLSVTGATSETTVTDTTTGTGVMTATAPNTTTVPLKVILKASQTADGFNLLASDGTTVLAKLDNNGNITAPNLGTASALNTGTSSGDVPVLTTGGALPAVSAANLTSFPTLNQNTTGTAANVSGTPALPNGTTASTQTAADDSTKLATTAYTDGAVSTETSRAETAEALALPKTGGTMSGAIAMGTNKVTGIGNGSGAQDAAAFGQIPTSASSIGGLLAANNLSDVGTLATAQTNLGIGTAGLLNTGTTSGTIPELTTGGALPAVSAANLTNIPAPSSPVTLTSTATTQVPLKLVSDSGQTGDLIDIYASDGTTKLFSVDSSGDAIAKTAIQAATLVATQYIDGPSNFQIQPSGVVQTSGGIYPYAGIPQVGVAITSGTAFNAPSFSTNPGYTGPLSCVIDVPIVMSPTGGAAATVVVSRTTGNGGNTASWTALSEPAGLTSGSIQTLSIMCPGSGRTIENCSLTITLTNATFQGVTVAGVSTKQGIATAI